MHTPKRYPDWFRTPYANLTVWQRIGKKTGGFVTPGNILTLAGLILVVSGLLLLRQHDYETAIILIVIGRICDVTDGIVAERTKTKGPVGEIFDALADKIEIFALAVLVIAHELVPAYLIGPILTINAINLVANVFARLQGLPLHTNIYGKLFGVASWTILPIYIFTHVHYSSYAWPFKALFLVAYLETLYLGILSSFNYVLKVTQSLVVRQKIPLPSFRRALFIENPKSTNARRAKRYLKELDQHLGVDFQTISLNPKSQKSRQAFMKSISPPGPTLLCIGGGDGTVHNVVSTLLDAKVDLKDLTLLPLWGGNGNDLAVMLNGLPLQSDIRTIIKKSNRVRIHPLKITLNNARGTSTRYAMCYVSFGASAFATRELDKSSAARKGVLRHIGTVVVARELYHVAHALTHAPTFRAEIGGAKTEVYEHIFANGSRLAKVDRLPIKLTDYGYFSVLQETRHPSYLLKLLRLLSGRLRKQLSKEPYSFRIDGPITAQVDGELFKVSAKTSITISVERRSISALSTKL